MNRSTSLRRQAGVGIFGWFLILVMAGTLGLMGLRLFPLYIDYFQILDVARHIVSDASMTGRSTNDLRKAVAQRFRQNNLFIKGTNRPKDPKIIIFNRVSGRVNSATVKYEEQVNFFGNIDLVVKFNDQIYP